MNFRFFRIHQFLQESFVLLSVHGAVDIVGRTPVIAALPPSFIHIDGLGGDQRCGCIEEMQVIGTKILADGIGQRIGSQGAGGNDDGTFRHLGHFLLHHGDIGMVTDLIGHQLRKALTVHRQAATGFYTGGIGAFHNQAAHTAQLFLQQTHRIFQPIASQRVGTDQLRKGIGMVGRRLLMGFHFIEGHLDATLGQLPSRFAAGKTGANDLYHVFHGYSPFFLAADFFAAVFFAGFFSASSTTGSSCSVFFL